MIRNDVVSVGTSSVTLAARKNARRAGFSLNNSGAVAATITLSHVAAVANEGIVLQPGDIYAQSNTEGYVCWQGDIQAISSGAGTTISIQEQMEF